MNTLRITVFLVHCLVLLKVCSGASVDRYESAKPRTTVVSLFLTLEKKNTTGHQVDRGTNDYDEDYDLSVDYDSDQPRVAFSTKPKHPSAIPTTEKKTKKGKRKGKGRGNRRKKNPCLEEYKDFCIHGVCQHLKELNTHSCVCQVGYSGERCHLFTLGVSKKEQRYSRTTALAVIAVVLSFTCLTVIAILLALRYHKKDDADEESAEVIREERKMEPKRTDGTEEKQGHNC